MKGKRAGAPAPGVKTAVSPGIKEALGKALDNRAKQLGVDPKSLNGFGMKEGAEAQARQGAAAILGINPAPLAVSPAAEVKPLLDGEQGFLFGESDKIRAALSSELAIINAEIGATEKSKMNINEKIDILSRRRRIVEDAMNTLDRAKGKEDPAPKKKAQKKGKEKPPKSSTPGKPGKSKKSSTPPSDGESKSQKGGQL